MEGTVPVEVAIWGTIAGAALGFASSVLTTIILQSYESKRQLRALIVKLAFDEWKEQWEHSSKTSGKKLMSPLDTYLIHNARLVELMLSRRLTAKNINKKLDALHAVSDAVDEYKRKRFQAVATEVPAHEETNGGGE